MIADLNNLMRIEKFQIKPAAEVLAWAFQDDPIFVYFIPDASERKNKLPYLLRFLIRYGMSHGEVYATSPSLEGVAVWLPSEKTNRTLWRMIINGGSSLYFKLGRKIISRRRPVIDFISLIHKLRVPFRHWYLELIGVDPGFQGKGHGSALLRAMLARLDEEDVPCFLETQNGNNVPIYQHYGFKVVEDVVIPGTKLRHWAMLRENKS